MQRILTVFAVQARIALDVTDFLTFFWIVSVSVFTLLYSVTNPLTQNVTLQLQSWLVIPPVVKYDSPLFLNDAVILMICYSNKVSVALEFT